MNYSVLKNREDIEHNLDLNSPFQYCVLSDVPGSFHGAQSNTPFGGTSLASHLWVLVLADIYRVSFQHWYREWKWKQCVLIHCTELSILVQDRDSKKDELFPIVLVHFPLPVPVPIAGSVLETHSVTCTESVGQLLC